MRTMRRRGIFVCAVVNWTTTTPMLTQQVLLARPERRACKVRRAWSGRQVRKVFQAQRDPRGHWDPLVRPARQA